MSGTVPPIPPPLGTNPGNVGSPNRVDAILNDNTNNTGTNNVTPNVVVSEDLPQLLDTRGGSHVTNVLDFDVEDFSSWKDRFLVYLDGLEPYLLEIIENGPFVPKSPLSTSTNILPKPKNNGYIRTDGLLIKIRDLKAPSFLGEKVQGTITRMKILLNDLENKGVFIPQAEVNATFVNSLPRKWLSMNQTQRANNSIKNDSLHTLFGKYNYEEGLIDQIYESETQRFTIQSSTSKALISNTCIQDSESDVEEDTRSSSEFLADLKAVFQDSALIANQKRFYKRSGRDDESLSSKDEGVTRVKAFMAIAEDETAVGKAYARSVPGNIVRALGGRGKRKEAISPNEVLFTKADESPSKTALEITSDYKSECDNQDPLPPLPKLTGAEPIGTSTDVIPPANLTQTSIVSDKTKQVVDKESSVKVIKKKTQNKSPSVHDPCPAKKADSSTEQLLLTLMEEVKGLKEQIKPPSENSISVS
ncbi:hypothetical protein Tco_0503491 [Tanacetum coccineum]